MMTIKKRALKLGIAGSVIILVAVLALRLWLAADSRQEAQFRHLMEHADQQEYVHEYDGLRIDFGPNAHFDPWRLSTTDPARVIDPYLSNGHVGVSVGANGKVTQWAEAGLYKDGV